MNDNTPQHFLLTCRDCGKEFFTEGEKEFYENKGLTLPKRCKDCREKRKQATDDNIVPPTIMAVYDEIINNWSVEAKKENPAYFYNIDEVNLISNGRKSFVIGRKGSGKTAIAKFLCDIQDPLVYSCKITFKNFPFNLLYSLDNKAEYTAPNQYISLWKYLIFTNICKLMVNNENVDTTIREKLHKLYCRPSEKTLTKMIETWTSNEFGLQILGCGLNYGREKTHAIAWIEAIDILQQIIIDYCDSSKYYIVFDELDEDYKDFKKDEDLEQYMCMLTSLFKAVQDIRETLDPLGKNVFPVVFLRSDIFGRIKDSDKNKWHESTIELFWDHFQLKQMLAHRLCVAFEKEDTSFEEISKELFRDTHVTMGDRQKKHLPLFNYIERSTELRPRDFIQYIKETVTIAKRISQYPIKAATIKDADDNFSEYLKRETIDELFAVLPEVNEILGLLSIIRKQTFGFESFEKEYNSLVKQGVIPKRDVKYILLLLFDAGVIGNQPSMKGKDIFSYKQNSPRFNFNESMIIHRGLFKSLQIY